MLRLAVAVLATVALTLAAAWSLGVEPHNARADGPQSDPMADILREHRTECMERHLLLTVKNQGGVIVQSCDPFNVGVVPVARQP